MYSGPELELFHGLRFGNSSSLIGLNFTDSNQKVSFAFQLGGSYHEDLDLKDMDVTAGEETLNSVADNCCVTSNQLADENGERVASIEAYGLYGSFFLFGVN